MINPVAYSLGANRSCIRDLFEYGRQRAAIVGEENVFDYSLGNPSIPAPDYVNQTVRDVLSEMDSLAVHGYTSAIGDFHTRKAIAEDLNARYQSNVRPEDLFIGCGAAPELCAVFSALAHNFRFFKGKFINCRHNYSIARFFYLTKCLRNTRIFRINF